MDLERDQKVRRVISNEQIVSTKKSFGKKLAETFLPEDLKTIKDYIIYDYIAPGIKNLILNTISMAFYNETISPSYHRGDGRSNNQKTSYNRCYERNSHNRRNNRRDEREEESDFDYRNVILTDWNSAQNLVEEMHGRIDKFGCVSVMEFMDMLGLSGSYQDTKWGWDNKRSISTKRVSNGFLIKVDAAIYLDAE